MRYRLGYAVERLTACHIFKLKCPALIDHAVIRRSTAGNVIDRCASNNVCSEIVSSQLACSDLLLSGVRVHVPKCSTTCPKTEVALSRESLANYSHAQ